MIIKFKYLLVFICILIIFIAGYFIFQLSSDKENLPLNTSDTNINEPTNLNSTASTNSSEMSEILNTNTTDTQPKSTNQTGEVDPDAVLFDKAYAAVDRAICDQIKSEPSKLLCNAYIINAKAKSENNIKLCEEITDDFYRTDCHDNVIDFLAKQEKSKAKCGELIDKKRFEECTAGVQ